MHTNNADLYKVANAIPSRYRDIGNLIKQIIDVLESQKYYIHEKSKEDLTKLINDLRAYAMADSRNQLDYFLDLLKFLPIAQLILTLDPKLLGNNDIPMRIMYGLLFLLAIGNILSINQQIGLANGTLTQAGILAYLKGMYARNQELLAQANRPLQEVIEGFQAGLNLQGKLEEKQGPVQLEYNIITDVYIWSAFFFIAGLILLLRDPDIDIGSTDYLLQLLLFCTTMLATHLRKRSLSVEVGTAAYRITNRET